MTTENELPEREDPAKGRDLEVAGTRFTYIKSRLLGGAVYASDDGQHFLRSGDSGEVAGEINLTRDLYGRGFPVPEITETGELESVGHFYVEKSIGDEVFGETFGRETREQGHVSDRSFAQMTSVMERYAKAQFSPPNFVPAGPSHLEGVIALANVLRNNTPSAEMTPAFNEALAKATERVQELPFGYVQADLNAYNILPDGIIDFELAGFGPVGYDLLMNIHFGKMWPANKVAYRYTEEQEQKYAQAIQKVAADGGIVNLDQYMNDFLVLKALWATGKDKASENDPSLYAEFWEWRVNMRDWVIRRYVAGEEIDTKLFEEAGKGKI